MSPELKLAALCGLALVIFGLGVFAGACMATRASDDEDDRDDGAPGDT